LGVLSLMFALWALPAVATERLFEDDFETGLSGWEVSDPAAITIVDSEDPDHGKVLRLAPAGARLHALIRGSEEWGAYRVEGEVLFPTDEHNYLGLIYHFREGGRRVDLGSLYIKGNGSYIRVNPRRDWNPARMLYEEYRTALTGQDAIVIGEWQRFAAEVAGPVCHLYVGDLTTPKVTFGLYEADSGRLGFKPRVVGGPVWLDNVRVTGIGRLSYSGPRLPPTSAPSSRCPRGNAPASSSARWTTWPSGPTACSTAISSYATGSPGTISDGTRTIPAPTATVCWVRARTACWCGCAAASTPPAASSPVWWRNRQRSKI
jgi:hypothetical protein